MAIGRRLPDAGLVHHSDRGCQYASGDYPSVLADHGLTCSMSRKGNCWDNAGVERFLFGIKTALGYRHVWPTRDAASKAITEWIEVFYNRHRRPWPGSCAASPTMATTPARASVQSEPRALARVMVTLRQAGLQRGEAGILLSTPPVVQ
jgi:hypothetical protein